MRPDRVGKNVVFTSATETSAFAVLYDHNFLCCFPERAVGIVAAEVVVDGFRGVREAAFVRAPTRAAVFRPVRLERHASVESDSDALVSSERSAAGPLRLRKKS